MNEKVFHAELNKGLREQGYWARKWPDTAAGPMDNKEDGKLRFNLPKPFDIVFCSPTGFFGAIECKMPNGPNLKYDEHVQEQVKTLTTIAAHKGIAALAINYRYVRKRTGKTNRAFLLWSHIFEMLPEKIDIPFCEIWGTELIRKSQAWYLPDHGS